MNRVYVRKIFHHDVTHEVSVRTDITQNFFGRISEFHVRGKRTGTEGTVKINNATDPRFGGALKSIIAAEGFVEEDEIILFHKKGTADYLLEIIRFDDERFSKLSALFSGKERHCILSESDLENILR